MKLVVMDGQGGGMGRALVEQIKRAWPVQSVLCVGTNAMATAAMLKAGADAGATGENAVLVNCRDADIIVGPIGIVLADALLGEVTPGMAAAVSRSGALKILIPQSKCHVRVVGAQGMTLNLAAAEAVELIRAVMRESED